MRKIACPHCGSDKWITALVRLYFTYDVIGQNQTKEKEPRPVLLLGRRQEEIESGLDQELKCMICGNDFGVPENVRMFRRNKGPLEDANI